MSLKSVKDVNARNSHGQTPLMIATHWQERKFIKKLLKQGADTTVVDKNGNTAVSYCSLHNNRKIHNLLVRRAVLDKCKFVNEGPSPGFRNSVNEQWFLNRYVPTDDDEYWDKHKLFFIQIPKTASCSIANQLDQRSIFSHMLGKYYPIRIKDKLKTVVRNPYDRLVSAYHFMIEGGFFKNNEYFEIRYKYNSFEDWVLNGLTKDLLKYDGMHPAYELLMLQTDFLLNDEGEFVVDFKKNVVRYECLNEDVERVFGFKLSVHYNRSTHLSWETYYTNNNVTDKVYELYKQDFEMLKYNKNIENVLFSI